MSAEPHSASSGAEATTIQRPQLRHALAIVALAGHLFVVPPLLATVRMNRLTLGESLLLFAGTTLLVWIGVALALLAAAGVARLLDWPPDRRAQSWWMGATAAPVVFFSIAVYRSFLQIEALDRHAAEQSFGAAKLALAGKIALTAVVALLVFLAAAALFRKIWRDRPARLFTLFLLLEGGLVLLSGVTMVVTHLGWRPQNVTTEIVIPAPSESDSRVFVIGVDGADWMVVNRLRSENLLPNWDALIRDGRHSELETLEPTISPNIWTSLYTGKRPEEHNIRDFVMYRVPGIERDIWLPPRWSIGMLSLVKIGLLSQDPMSSRYRTARTIWDITLEADLPTLHIGTIATWPVDPVFGVMLTDRLIESVELYRETRDREALQRELADMASEPDLVLELIDERMVDGFPETESHLHEALYWPLYERVQPRLSILYLPTVDRISHKYFCCDDVCLPDRAACNQPVVDAYLASDAALGRIRAVARPEDTIILLSDHGFDLYRKGFDMFRSHFGVNGVFVMAGGAVTPGVGEPVSVYDLMPTLLHLLGLPTGRDMVGRVRTDYLRPEFMAAHPVREVSTYEREVYPLVPEERADYLAEDLKEKLRGLGYID